MNVIDEHDFWGLVEDQEFITPSKTNPYNPYVEEAAEEYNETTEDFDLKGFQINFEDEENQKKMPSRKNDSSRELTGKYVDYKKLQSKKTSVGKAGEYLVLDFPKEQYEGADVEIEHVAETEGDGCGYDIRLTLEGKKEVHIEVKTTTFNYVD